MNLDNIRRRQERAIEFVTGRTGFNTSPDDPKRCLAATYIVVMNDVPALMLAVERLSSQATNLAKALREVYNDEAPNMLEWQLDEVIRKAANGEH